MKQTAVEKFRENFYDYAEPYNGFSEEPKWTISEEDFEKLIQKAKEMEKEQILDAHIKGHNAPSSTLKHYDAEQYYNETFKLK